uniref:Cytochrome P450 26A1 n=1 Tax=Neolamprologus brichardi TaxID=32507 RepID=A0A3Q4GW81_NEOBR
MKYYIQFKRESLGFPELLGSRKTFLRMKREKYGYIYRTHLFGNRTVRVTGADNVKQILLGEHRLVSAQWPASVRAILGTETLSNVHGAQHKTKKKAILRAFSREALELYIPVIQEEVQAAWLALLPHSIEAGLNPTGRLLLWNLALCVQAEQGMDLQSLNIESLEQLKYTGCVIKETLRINPPVPGGFRVALKTFELNGYQIPKGWNVVYSICDTHDVAEIFPDKEDFQPERFLTDPCADSSRFQYIPFGGGSRMCIGKEFAKVLLKVFLVEVVTKCHWTLLNGPPTMKTGPTVYPEDNLPTKFTSYVHN